MNRTKRRTGDRWHVELSSRTTYPRRRLLSSASPDVVTGICDHRSAVETVPEAIADSPP